MGDAKARPFLAMITCLLALGLAAIKQSNTGGGMRAKKKVRDDRQETVESFIARGGTISRVAGQPTPDSAAGWATLPLSNDWESIVDSDNLTVVWEDDMDLDDDLSDLDELG
jgi:hypothetical protein